MIIDLILDRKDGAKYNSKEFYNSVTNYQEIGFPIASALDGGTNNDVVNALKSYITVNQYNTNICEYVASVKWL